MLSVYIYIYIYNHIYIYIYIHLVNPIPYVWRISFRWFHSTEALEKQLLLQQQLASAEQRCEAPGGTRDLRDADSVGCFVVD